MNKQLILIFVSFHTSLNEVIKLKSCLEKLPVNIGYAVFVNEYIPFEPINALRANADCFVTSPQNFGYGRAVNQIVERLNTKPPYIGILNTDLVWNQGTFENLVSWLLESPNVVLAVPQILDPDGNIQFLCKQNPTVLALMSRRFIPEYLKPIALKKYDQWYSMQEKNYDTIFSVPYLSGCCMIVQTDAFFRCGGFDERYFLYLEDADLSRSLCQYGQCVHLPIESVVHTWGKGNYKKLSLVLVNLQSAWIYFTKWGFKWF